MDLTQRHRAFSFPRLLTFLLLTTLLAACSVDKYVADDQLYLRSVKVVSTEPEVTKPYQLSGYVKQSPNVKWFGAKVPMRIYCASNPNSKSWTSKLLRKIGEEPVLFDTLRTQRTIEDIEQVLSNAGYMHSSVELVNDIHGKKLDLTYKVTPGERYSVRSLERVVDDPKLRELICGPDTADSHLSIGMPMDVNKLNSERSRITNLLRSMGYYKFNKDDITYRADTLAGSLSVDLLMHVRLHLENGRSDPENHTQYRIGDVTYQVEGGAEHFRRSLLTSNTRLISGELYNDAHLRQTYNNFTRLQAISYSNIRINERPGTDTLDCQIVLNRAQPRSFSFDLEGTNSAGDLGAAASASFQNKNLFKGSETLTLKLRGAYEAITGLDGYEGHNYIELGGEARLAFPGFLLPLVSHEFASLHAATSEISLQYNRQNRPEFNRRVLTAAWRYRWQSMNKKVQHRFDLLEVNYIYMPWISTRFREQYLDSLGRQNAILRYNYENLLITKLGYTYSFNSLGTSATTTYGQNAYTLRFNIETSGNVLGTLTRIFDAKRNDQDQRTFCGIAFAQYVRGDFDWAKSIRIDRNNSMALHAGFGIAVPYGNSNQLPFEKRYFAGGANSVRGWSVRSLGPGAYKGADRQINFLNQSGDIKLDLSMEYRALLFWKLNGAIFVDAGNIWTIRKYDDQPEGEFRFDKFYEQIAMSYGIGLRLALDFFTLRFDAGMKAINPAYKGRDHYPIIHPNLDRDFAFHFAIGLPF